MVWIVVAWAAEPTFQLPDGALPETGPYGWTDVDGDGTIDLLAAHPTRGVVLAWPSSRPSAEPEVLTPPGACGPLTLAVEASPPTLVVSWTDPTRHRRYAAEYAVDAELALVERWWDEEGRGGALRYLGDVDGDAASDVLASGQVRLSGTGRWVALPVDPEDAAVPAVTYRVDDLDGDGFADVVRSFDGPYRDDWYGLQETTVLRAFRGSPDGFLDDPMWTVEPVEQPDEDPLWPSEWHSPTLVVRPPGSDRLVVGWLYDGRESKRVDHLDVWTDIGVAPVVAQSVEPLTVGSWWLDTAWIAELSFPAGGDGVVVAADHSFAWVGFDPATGLLADTAHAYAYGGPIGERVPGPMVASNGDEWVVGYNVWGWPLAAEALLTPVEGDPRLDDCGPLPHPEPDASEPSVGIRGPELGALPSLPSASGAGPTCGCGVGVDGSPLLVWLVVLGLRRRGGSGRAFQGQAAL